jgi:hypothetical protein
MQKKHTLIKDVSMNSITPIAAYVHAIDVLNVMILLSMKK